MVALLFLSSFPSPSPSPPSPPALPPFLMARRFSVLIITIYNPPSSSFSFPAPLSLYSTNYIAPTVDIARSPPHTHTHRSNDLALMCGWTCSSYGGFCIVPFPCQPLYLLDDLALWIQETSLHLPFAHHPIPRQK